MFWVPQLQRRTGHWANANYQKKWERPIHVIYLDTNNQEGFNQKCGIKIFGESTRRQPDKSMKIIARMNMELAVFSHEIFPQKNIQHTNNWLFEHLGMIIKALVLKMF